MLALPNEVVANFEPIDEVPTDVVARYDDFTYEGHHDVLSSALYVGNTFAINPDASTNFEDADFYLVNCVATKEKVKKGYIDEWGNVIDKGS